MKKFILSASLIFTAFLVSHAQDDVKYEKLVIKAGDKLSYHVNTGKEYDFIVNVKTLKVDQEYPIVFDWKMTDPVNVDGSIKIASDAAKKSHALYNMFGPGEKILSDETSVFVSTEILTKLNKASTGDIIKFNVGGAGSEEEDFIVDEINFPFLYKDKGENKNIKTKLLRNRSNGHVIIIYPGPTTALIVSMSIGFEIALESVN